MKIEHATTDDLPNGIPVPPVTDDPDQLWSLVSRSDGFTFWRRITLTTEKETQQ